MIRTIFGLLKEYRFELFFLSLISILFGSLVVPYSFYEDYLYSLLFVINILSGILLIDKKRKVNKVLIGLFILALIIFGINPFVSWTIRSEEFRYVELITYFVFYVVVSIELTRQVWHAQKVNKTVIFGMMSGYISLGLIGFFIFFSIEATSPEAFSGVAMETTQLAVKVDALLYYSYITLLTIGYGEIYPVTSTAQKAAIFVGLMGQFYLVIITATVVGKYIAQFSKTKDL